MSKRPLRRREPDLEPDGSEGGRVGMPVDAERITSVLKRTRKQWIAAALVGVVLGLVLAKLLVPASYIADTTLKFDGYPTVKGVPMPTHNDFGTLVADITSDDLLRQVKHDLHLKRSVRDLRHLVDVATDPVGEAVNIKTPGDSPSQAAAFANTLAKRFLEYRTKSERTRLESLSAHLDERLKAASKELQGSRRTYDEFRKAHGIADLNTEQEQRITSAADLQAKAGIAESDVKALEARTEQLEKDLHGTPSTVSAGRASPAAQQLAKLRVELTQLRAQYTDEYPRVRALEEQAAALQQQIRSGKADGSSLSNPQYASTRTALMQAKADLEAAKQKQKELTSLASTAAQSVDRLSQNEGQASRLLAAVRVDEGLLNDLQDRKTRVQDALRDPEPGFRVLSPATDPEYPESARKQRILVAAAVPTLLLLLVLGMAFYGELRGFKVRTSREVAFWGGGPVVGATRWPRTPQGIYELVADMDDCVPVTQGLTLVVAASDREQPLAEHLAAELNADWMPTQLFGASENPSDAPVVSIVRRPASELVVRSQFANDDLRGEGRLEHRIEAWHGALDGQPIRRAARLADRVAVVVSANNTSALDLRRIPTRLGRTEGVGYVLVGLDDELATLPDRQGDVEAFWRAAR